MLSLSKLSERWPIIFGMQATWFFGPFSVSYYSVPSTFFSVRSPGMTGVLFTGILYLNLTNPNKYYSNLFSSHLSILG